MPRWLMKLADDEYVEWSTIVDAPIGGLLGREEAVEQHGEDRVAWTDRHLCSCRARLGETARRHADGGVVTVGGGDLAYSFASYDEVHAFMVNEGYNGCGATSIDGIRAYAREGS